jgi:hypothetical protein
MTITNKIVKIPGDGWVEVKAVLWIACSNKKLAQATSHLVALEIGIKLVLNPVLNRLGTGSSNYPTYSITESRASKYWIHLKTGQICPVFEWSVNQMPGTRHNQPFEYRNSLVFGYPLSVVCLLLQGSFFTMLGKDSTVKLR